MSQLSRRNFLKLIVNALLGISGALGLAGFVRYFSFQSDPPPPREFDIGPAAGYPQGTTNLLPQIPAALRHTSKGYIAISMKCTHLGCTVNDFYSVCVVIMDGLPPAIQAANALYKLLQTNSNG